jgi:hypothetical protein
LESTNGCDGHLQAPRRANIQGYLPEPEQVTGAAAIVVIREWWGVNEQIRGVADRLATPSGRSGPGIALSVSSAAGSDEELR